MEGATGVERSRRPWPGRVDWGSFPRVALRFTRGYIPAPRWGLGRGEFVVR
jgi:hypothetical protein